MARGAENEQKHGRGALSRSKSDTSGEPACSSSALAYDEAMKTLSLILLLTIAMMAVAAGSRLEAAEPWPSSGGWITGYPGPPPGPATITCRGSEITVGNKALSMSWTWSPLGLRRAMPDRRPHRTDAPDRRRGVPDHSRRWPQYPASALHRGGLPRVSEVRRIPGRHGWQPARIPGRQVELPLEASDGRLRPVIWRAIAHDDSNYLPRR